MSAIFGGAPSAHMSEAVYNLVCVTRTCRTVSSRYWGSNGCCSSLLPKPKQDDNDILAVLMGVQVWQLFDRLNGTSNRQQQTRAIMMS